MVRVIAIKKKSMNKQNNYATKKEVKQKKGRSTKADISQEQEWEVLQKDDYAEWKVPVQIRKQKRSGSWLGWLFGFKKEESSEEIQYDDDRGIGVSEQED